MAAKGTLKQVSLIAGFLALCMALIAEWAGLRQGLQDNLVAYLSKRQDVVIVASPHPRGNGHRTVAGVEGTRTQQGSQWLFLKGSDFHGGTGRMTGYSMFDKENVNAVCARSTGPGSEMRASFELPSVPQDETFLYLLARHDYFPDSAELQIALNGEDIVRGPSRFASKVWQWTRLPIPSGALKAGPNELVVANLAERGAVNDVPRFIVAELYLGGRDFVPPGYLVAVSPPRPPEPTPSPRPEAKEPGLLGRGHIEITLPTELRPLPEPLPEGRSEPGFKIRGPRGWAWTPEQYLAEIPIIAKYKMNFLFLCYLSMFDSPKGDNRWWAPLPPAKREGYERVVRSCQEHGINFCFAMNPNRASSRPLKYDSEQDANDLYAHFAWMQGLGVKWFSLCLDDISTGIDASGQARLVTEFLRRLRAKDPEAQMVFCPTIYWGGGGSPYLKTMAWELPEDVYVFWTGPQVFSGTVDTFAAKSYRACIKRRLIYWDNYPVNDGTLILSLGPVMERAPDLCEVVDGYVTNPLYPQTEINRIPLLTCADYAYNPWAYDPMRSIGQAILHLAETPEQRQVLKELVEMYPGWQVLARRQIHCSSPLITRFFNALEEEEGLPEAVEIMEQVRDVERRLETHFPGRYQATVKTVEYHLALMKAAYDQKCGRLPKNAPAPPAPW